MVLVCFRAYGLGFDKGLRFDGAGVSNFRGQGTGL